MSPIRVLMASASSSRTIASSHRPPANGTKEASSSVHCRYQSSPAGRSIASSSAVSDSSCPRSPRRSATSLSASTARTWSCSSPVSSASARARSALLQGFVEMQVVGDRQGPAAEDPDLERKVGELLGDRQGLGVVLGRAFEIEALLGEREALERLGLEPPVARRARPLEGAAVVRDARVRVAGRPASAIPARAARGVPARRPPLTVPAETRPPAPRRSGRSPPRGRGPAAPAKRRATGIRGSWRRRRPPRSGGRALRHALRAGPLGPAPVPRPPADAGAPGARPRADRRSSRE